MAETTVCKDKGATNGDGPGLGWNLTFDEKETQAATGQAGRQAGISIDLGCLFVLCAMSSDASSGTNYLVHASTRLRHQ